MWKFLKIKFLIHRLIGCLFWFLESFLGTPLGLFLVMPTHILLVFHIHGQCCLGLFFVYINVCAFIFYMWALPSPKEMDNWGMFFNSAGMTGKKKKKKAARKKAGGDVKNGGFLVASCSDAILDKVEGTSLPASQLHGSLGKHEPWCLAKWWVPTWKGVEVNWTSKGWSTSPVEKDRERWRCSA